MVSAKGEGGIHSFLPSFIYSPDMYEMTDTLTGSGKAKARNTVSTLEGLMVGKEIETEPGAIWLECNPEFEPPCYTLKT